MKSAACARQIPAKPPRVGQSPMRIIPLMPTHKTCACNPIRKHYLCFALWVGSLCARALVLMDFLESSTGLSIEIGAWFFLAKHVHVGNYRSWFVANVAIRKNDLCQERPSGRTDVIYRARRKSWKRREKVGDTTCGSSPDANKSKDTGSSNV